jgi:hypothetical protein
MLIAPVEIVSFWIVLLTHQTGRERQEEPFVTPKQSSSTPGHPTGLLLIMMSFGLVLIVLDHYLLGAEVIGTAVVVWREQSRP